MQAYQLQQVYKMVDSVPFSRSKKNISRDFADAVMMAQLLYNFNPKMIELHNYPPANSLSKKVQNWSTLNKKVLKKIGVSLGKEQIQAIASAVPGAIEEVLYMVLLKFEQPENQANLIKHAKLMQSRNTDRQEGQDQGESPGIENQNKTPKKSQGTPGKGNRVSPLLEPDSESQQIMKLVARIDQATQKLNHLRDQSNLKDDIISTLEKKIQKLIFN